MVNMESLPSPILRHISRLTVGGGEITSIIVKRLPIATNNRNNKNNLSKEGETSRVLHNNSTSTSSKTSSFNSESTRHPDCCRSLCRKGDAFKKRKNQNCGQSKIGFKPMVKPSRSPSPPSCLRSNCDPSRHRRSHPSNCLESPARRMTYSDTLFSGDLSTDRLFPPSNIHHQQRGLERQVTDSPSISRRFRSSTSCRSSAKQTETAWPCIFNASEMSSTATSDHSIFDLMDDCPDYKQHYARKSLKKNRQANQSYLGGSKDAIVDGYNHCLGDDAPFPPTRVVSEANQRGGACLVMSLTELRPSDSSQSYDKRE